MSSDVYMKEYGMYSKDDIHAMYTPSETDPLCVCVLVDSPIVKVMSYNKQWADELKNAPLAPDARDGKKRIIIESETVQEVVDAICAMLEKLPVRK